ncbi:hypothetical protein ACF1BQ_030460 [Bradyrhizobium sp. RDT10]
MQTASSAIAAGALPSAASPTSAQSSGEF